MPPKDTTVTLVHTSACFIPEKKTSLPVRNFGSPPVKTSDIPWKIYEATCEKQILPVKKEEELHP